MRRYHEPVEVRTVSGMPSPATVEFDHPGPPGRPEAFLWRGRLYVVREVLGHWRERRAWWHGALDPGQPRGTAAAARERHVWRVEASAGRLAARGVFDLACDEPAEPSGRGADDAGATRAAGAAGWQLVQVAD